MIESKEKHPIPPFSDHRTTEDQREQRTMIERNSCRQDDAIITKDGAATKKVLILKPQIIKRKQKTFITAGHSLAICDTHEMDAPG